ncbi:MAG: restriction endonuclease subunit S [Clostridiales bacterium]|nr:restriction endonuclease subunit S [Clostridiales bacterium]
MRSKFADVLEIRNGKNQRQVENPQGKYPIYGSGGVMGYADDFICDAETVVIGRKGSINNPIFVNEPFWNVDTAFGLVANRQILLPKYLYYFCVHYDFERLNTTVTIPSLTKANLLQISIDIPELNQQKDIVEKLDKIEHLISLRKQQLTKMDELVKARFVEMFGNPILNEKRWNQAPLSACVKSIDNGKSFVCDSAARQDDWPAILKLSAATYGYYRPEENKALLDKKQFVEESAVRAGDLLFTRKNTPELVGMCAYVYDTPSNLMMPDLIFRLNTTEKCNKIFLWKLINHELFRERIQAIATGSAKSMSNISKERLLGIEIILPPVELQTQFAAFVQSTDQIKSTIQSSLDELETLKKSLMQTYFG